MSPFTARVWIIEQHPPKLDWEMTSWRSLKRKHMFRNVFVRRTFLGHICWCKEQRIEGETNIGSRVQLSSWRFCRGRNLEIGWATLVLRISNNEGFTVRRWKINFPFLVFLPSKEDSGLGDSSRDIAWTCWTSSPNRSRTRSHLDRLPRSIHLVKIQPCSINSLCSALLAHFIRQLPVVFSPFPRHLSQPVHFIRQLPVVFLPFPRHLLNFRLMRCSSDLIVSRLSSSNLTNSSINCSFLTSKTICFIIFQMPFGRISRSQKTFKAFEIDMGSRDLRKTFFFSLIPRCCFILLLAGGPGATTSSRLSEHLHFVHSTILLCRI